MTQKASVIFALAVLSLATCRAGAATEAAVDKSRYTLLDPTPRALMRDLSTDRPDTTESPYTVDAGHVQVELSFVDYTYNDDDGGQVYVLSLVPSNIKLGLLNNADIQFVLEPYVHQRVRTDGANETAEGFGSAQVRFKLNLWGNDGGDTALAVMPFVAFPTTASDDNFGLTDHVEGGLIVPLAISLPNEWGLGLMAEVDFVRDDDDTGYGTQFLHTATIGHNIAGELGGYLEYAGLTSVDLDQGYIAVLGGGLTYGLSPDVQLDGGVNFGISEAADDVNVFLGMSVRR